MRKPRKTRCRGLFLAIGVLLAVAVGTLGKTQRSSVSIAPSKMDVTPRELARIAPGTVIADDAPAGWTHLVIKSYPRVGEDSEDRVLPMFVKMANFLFTAMLARVEEEEGNATAGRFRLARIAVGVGTEVEGQDTVLSSVSHKRLGANLGVIDQKVLQGGEKELDGMTCVARSPTMAIVDARTFMLYQGRHHAVVIRYALLLDPWTGRLDVLVWPLMHPHMPDAVPLGPIEWLPPNRIQDCILHVDTARVFFGTPTSEEAFAAVGPPSGLKTIEVPETLKRPAAASPFTVKTARNLETRLRELVVKHGKRGQERGVRVRGSGTPARH